MNIKLLFPLLVALSVPVFAQSYLTTPPTGTQTDGPDSTLIFGWAANSTHRFMDFAQAGPARTIRGVSFRLDYRNHNAIGRTWSNVTVRVAHGDWRSVQYNKSSAFRLTDTPIKVFDQQWSFPAVTGFPPLNPASWRGFQNSLSFRFSQPWNYNGRDAIFLEFKFSGGTAHNNKPWVGQTPTGFEYYLDSMPEAAWRGQGGSQRFPAKPTPCYDSAQKTPAAVTVKLSNTTSADLDIASSFTSRTKPVIHVVGLSGNTSGVNVGAQCNLLYPALGNAALLVKPAPNNPTATARTSIKTPALPWLQELWVQVGWFDSTTSRLKLTAAQRVTPAGQIVPAAVSYTAGGPISVWTSAAKGRPYIRYDL